MLQVEVLNTRMQNAREQKVDGALADEDFQIIKKETNNKLDKIEKLLDNLSDKHKEIYYLISIDVKKLSRLDLRFENKTIDETRKKE